MVCGGRLPFCSLAAALIVAGAGPASAPASANAARPASAPLSSQLSAPLSDWPEDPPLLSAELELRLELVINGAQTGQVVPVILRDDHAVVQAADLQRAGLILDAAMAGPIDLASLPQVVTSYDEGTQRLLVQVPDAMLPRHFLGHENAVGMVEPQSAFGGLLNYDLYLTDTSLALGYEARLFGGFGALRNTGGYRAARGRTDGGLIRFDSNWTYVDEVRANIFEAGDVVPRTLAWTNAVRLGGLQVSRNFAVRPDIVTYPLPAFSGSAQAPTAVDLFINGYRTSHHEVQPGPFTLREIPYVNGAGEAVVVTRNAQGQQVRVAIPFYVATTLLRPGLTDYALSLGFLRRDYGTKSFAYGELAGSAALRHGLTRDLTVELTAQRAGALTLAGAGAAFKLGVLGVVNASWAWNQQDRRTGQQWTWGYQYQGRRLSFLVNHTRRSRNFSDMASYASGSDPLARSQVQARANFVLPDSHGAIGVGYLATRGDARFRLADISYNRALGRSTLNLLANRDFTSHAYSVLAQIIVPLGRHGTAMMGSERTATGAIRGRLDYHRTVPGEGGLGWDMAARTGSDQSSGFEGSLIWRTPVTQVQAGVRSLGKRTGGSGVSGWGGLSGSLVWMDGGLFPANRINDGFTLVSTDGIAGVPVLYENRLAGVTNRQGHLFVPWVPPYHSAKYEIDLLNLPADVTAPMVEQHAAVKWGSGRLVRFAMEKFAAAHIVLQDRQSRPLPAGLAVTVSRISGSGSETSTAVNTVVGFDGLVYLENPAENNRLTARLPDGSACHAAFSFVAADTAITRIGPLLCQ